MNSDLKVLTLSAPYFDWVQLFHELKVMIDVEFVELFGRQYIAPYHFDPIRSLGTGKDHQFIELDGLRTFTAQIKTRGVCFKTLTSLPKPLGLGEIRNPSCKRHLD